jgi:hypothetical protein
VLGITAEVGAALLDADVALVVGGLPQAKRRVGGRRRDGRLLGRRRSAGAVCGTGRAVLATGAGAAGAAFAARKGWSFVAPNPDSRSCEASVTGAGVAGGALFATGAGGAAGAGGGLSATRAGAGACTEGAGGGLLATSSSSEFLPFKFMCFRLMRDPLLDTERQSSELQLRGASMWILCPPISKEMPLPAWALVVNISSAAAAARLNDFFMSASHLGVNSLTNVSGPYARAAVPSVIGITGGRASSKRALSRTRSAPGCSSPVGNAGVTHVTFK